ncbi:MAG: DUF1492 domain-containing protein [Christensenellaceae bacterium]|jgi:hypothetical protein|nr:DUF1492 domain-containing protein [Christensenellaceae bacterium]
MLLPKAAVDKIILKLCAIEELRARSTPADRRWLMALDSVINSLNPEMRRLVSMHFFENRTGLEVMEALCIERSTFYVWREQILLQFAVAAAESGALQVFYD